MKPFCLLSVVVGVENTQKDKKWTVDIMVSFFVIFVLLSISSDNHPSVFSNKLFFAKQEEMGDLFRSMERQHLRLKPALDIIEDEDKVLLFTLIFNPRLS